MVHIRRMMETIIFPAVELPPTQKVYFTPLPPSHHTPPLKITILTLNRTQIPFTTWPYLKVVKVAGFEAFMTYPKCFASLEDFDEFHAGHLMNVL